MGIRLYQNNAYVYTESMRKGKQVCGADRQPTERAAKHKSQHENIIG